MKLLHSAVRCNEKIIFTIPFSFSVDGIGLDQKESMTWEDFNFKCEGHLASLNEISSQYVQTKLLNNISPTSRFWVGHRIWSYINYQFGKKYIIFSYMYM